jgi:diguanylate cyclase (GGDEF)-like protein
MSDSGDPTNPQPDGDGVPTPESGAVVPAQGEPRTQPAADAQSAGEMASDSATPSPTPTGAKSLFAGSRGIWAAVAALCVLLGAIASVIGAHAVAHSDANKERDAFPRTSAAIASTVKLGIEREEELGVGASTFFAGNPSASAAEFSRWVRWSKTLRRYPELQRLGLVALVRAPELAAFEARLTGRAVKRTTIGAPAGIAPGLRAIPPGSRSYYCFAATELTRTNLRHSPRGLDYCSQAPGLLATRDSGRTTFASISTGGKQGLAIETPVYRGNATPVSLLGRRAAFVGWLRTVLVPGGVLQGALAAHPGYAARLFRGAGATGIAFAAGAASGKTQATAIDLHDGWSVSTAGPLPVAAGVLADGNARRVLIGGILLSILLGVLIYLIGGGRLRMPARKPRALPHSDLYDALTGLPNHALTLDRAERMVARAGRQAGMLAGALLIDIDWFKDVNEKLGTAAGDQLLKTVARRLENVIRAEDTVGRLGGDEFVVLVESSARGVRLDSLAGRIIEALHKPIELEDFGPGFFATASIGVAFGRYETPDDLMRDAQLALYSAKAAGKDRYTLFNANMRSMTESRGVLEAELNAALLDGQFSLLYQPIYDLTNHRVVGLEAFLRWQHPQRGILGPEDFVPVAEETGLIVPIGRWALEQACTRTAAWNVTGHRVGISVKVSANQLNRDGFETDVRRALQQSGLDPVLLTLEISEATVMRDMASATRRIAEIKQLGVRIAIDDFGGSGYARHDDLQTMALDVLKVDRSSLAASEDEAYRSWLLEAIMIVGRDLSLTIVATGIDSHEQITALQAMGCTMAQGPFTGLPVSSDQVESLFDVPLPTEPATAAVSEGSGSPAASTDLAQ